MSKWIPVRIPVAPGQQRCAPSGARCRVESVAMEGGSLVATLEGGSKWTAAVVERVFSMVERAVPECTPGNFVTVYPRGFGRDVERGEVITTRDLEHYRPPNTVIPTRCTVSMPDDLGSVIDQIRALGEDHRAVFAARPATNARCPRCGGPATTLLVSTTCERDGGCKTAEERVGEPFVQCAFTRQGEPHWFATGRFKTASHPTRDGAIAAWREAEITAERSR